MQFCCRESNIKLFGLYSSVGNSNNENTKYKRRKEETKNNNMSFEEVLDKEIYKRK